MPRNPTWTRDELIVCLDLYFRAGRKWLDSEHPDVIKLSQLLNALPIHPPESRNPDFRNPQGVSMKLGNFLSLDPQYEGVGLERGGSLDKEEWDEYADAHERLSQITQTITHIGPQQRFVEDLVG